MVDGVHFADHLCVVALGIDTDGVKHPLALVEGSTENTTLVRELLVGLREQGWTPPARCWRCWTGPRHSPQGCGRCSTGRSSPAASSTRIRNVRDKLPDKLRRVVESRMRAAYGAGSELEAKAALLALAGELDKTRPGAATSLREGLKETLTVLRLGVPPTLARKLRSTNAIESMIEICRNHARPRQALTGRADCAAVVRRRAWSRPAGSSAGSTATCTWPSSPPNTSEPPLKLSAPTRPMRPSKPPR